MTSLLDGTLVCPVNTATVDTLISGLNAEQSAFVTHEQGALLCLAGAGTGKTRALVHRIVHLIDSRDVPASAILALTFSNRAARELKDRIATSLAPERYKGLVVGTFHSIGLGIVREFSSHLGFQQTPLVAEEDRLVTFLSGRASEGSWHDHDLIPSGRTLYEWFQAIKVHLVLRADPSEEDQYRQPSDETFLSAALAAGVPVDEDIWSVRGIFLDYQQTLLSGNVVDFQDLICLPVHLCTMAPGAQAVLSRRFAHVLVDEFQDTNRLQESFLRIVADQATSIAVVGDDDQAIYGFRDADVSVIREFPKNWGPDCRVVHLRRNYRSARSIVRLANVLAPLQSNRPDRDFLNAVRDDEGRVRVLEFANDADEARWIIDDIHDQLERGHLESLNEVMVLFRVNHLGNTLSREFARSGLPFRTLSHSASPFLRAETKEVLAWLRLVVNATDGYALMRIADSLDGLGGVSVRKVLHHARANRCTILQALDDETLLASVGTRPRKGLLRVREGAHAIQRAYATNGPHAALLEAVRVSGVRDRVVADAAEAARDGDEHSELQEHAKLHAIDELIQLSHTLFREDRERLAVSDLTLLLDRVDLDLNGSGRRGEPGVDDLGAVRLLTIHASKGLEATHVYLVGHEDGNMPCTGDGIDVDEELRLFYVAVTRAQSELVVSRARTRERMGDLPELTRPSSFGRNLPLPTLVWNDGHARP